MKVLLIDLPIPYFNVNDEYASPLAIGYLKAYAEKKGLGKKCDIEIMDETWMNLSNDFALIKTITGKKPDILGFSTYSWNIERTLYIAGQVKKSLPDVKVVLGGPEINPDNLNVVAKPQIDILVNGEGESSFVNILNHFLDGKSELERINGIIFRNNNKWTVNQPSELISNLNEIPSPYISGYLNPSKFQYVTIETRRGCTYNCAYCYYGKGFKRTRDFKLERIEEELKIIKNSGGKYVYIIDSCINQARNFTQFCELLKKVNYDKAIEFQVEIKAELITKEDAKLLSKANVKLVEVGLQSTNPVALRNVGRHFEEEKFKEGVRLLKEAGIAIIVGIIIGLPGDTEEGIRRTVKFLLDSQKKNIIHIYPLCVLPGTRLRKDAGKFNLKYFPEPPYFTYKTPTLPQEKMKKLFLFSYSTFSKQMPDKEYSFTNVFTYSQGKYPYVPVEQFSKNTFDKIEIVRPISRVILRIDASIQKSEKMKELGEFLKDKTANSFSLHLISKNFDAGLKVILSLIEPVAAVNPYLVWNIILETDVLFNPELPKKIYDSIPVPRQYIDNYFYFHTKNKTERVAKRIFVVLPFGKKRFEKGWIKELTKRAFVHRAITLDGKFSFKSKFKEIEKMDEYGILIDFAPEVNTEFILDTIKDLPSKFPKGKIILFRNWAVQWLCNALLEGNTQLFNMNESILKFNDKFEWEYLPFNKSILNLDRMEWMLAAKEYGITLPVQIKKLNF